MNCKLPTGLSTATRTRWRTPLGGRERPAKEKFCPQPRRVNETATATNAATARDRRLLFFKMLRTSTFKTTVAYGKLKYSKGLDAAASPCPGVFRLRRRAQIVFGQRRLPRPRGTTESML